MLLRFILAVLLAASLSNAAAIAPRSIQRSGKSGDVSLVEFAVHSTIHGRCSYNDKGGRNVKLIYEETEGKITAKSLNPSVVDVDKAVRECRAAAAEVPKTSETEGRAGVPGSGLSPYEINARFNEFARINYENQQYVQQLQPRILTWLGNNMGLNFGGLSSNNVNNNFGLSWGNTGQSSNSLPGINLVAPSNAMNHHTVSYGNTNPFNFLYGNSASTGPWGVLNSISNSNQGGLGFPSFFSWLNPFSQFNPFSIG